MRTAVTAAAIAALLAGAATATAAPKPQINDAAGDYPVASADITSGSLALVAPRNKAITIKLNLSAAPSTSVPHTYSVAFTVADCSFRAAYYGHPFEGVFSTSGVGCQVEGETSLPEGAVEVVGSSVVWTVPAAAPLKKGAKVTGLTASTQFSGVMSGGAGEAVGDLATGTDWVIR